MTKIERPSRQVVEKSPKEPLSVASAELARKAQVERYQLFTEAERLTTALPRARNIYRTTLLNGRARTIVSDIERRRLAVLAFDRTQVPLEQLRRRVAELRNLRILVNVYAEILVLLPVIRANQQQLPNSDPQRYRVGELLETTPAITELSFEEEHRVITQYYEELRSANTTMLQTLATQSKLEFNATPQAVEVKGVRAVDGETIPIYSVKQLRFLLPTVYMNIQKLAANHPLRAGAVQMAEATSQLLRSIDQAPDQIRQTIDLADQLDKQQQALAELDQWLRTAIEIQARSSH